MTFKNHDADYWDRAADILYGKTTPGEKRKPEERRYSLGQSIYDDEDEEETKKFSLDKPEKKENPEDILYNHPTSQPKKKEDDKIDGMSMNDRAKTKEEEEQELLDLMYDHPTSQPGYRQNSEKERIEKDKIKQPEYDDEEGIVTGGAAKYIDTESNIRRGEKRPEDILKRLGMDGKEYKINGDTISRNRNGKDYEVVYGVKYPKNTDNKEVLKMKEEAQKLQDAENYQKREKYVTNPQSLLNRIGVDNVDNPIVKFGETKKSGNEAYENLHMSKADSYMNTDYAKKHKIYNNYKEAPEELREYLKGKISEQIGEDKLESTKGIYIDTNSDSSKSLKDNLLQDKDFIKILKDYEKPMNHNFYVDESISLKGPNWHNAVGNADIKRMHINKNGDVELYVTDTYDFNKNEISGPAAVGRDRQEKGEIKPYFEVYHVVIPKNEIDSIKTEMTRNSK